MCPTEESFSFLANVFAEVAALFPGPYIHIGGDEVMKDQWKACKSCAALMKREGLKDYDALQSYFVRRVGKIINGLGKKMAGWEEILEGGIDPGAMITVWLDPKAALKAVRTGHDVVIGMSDKLYFNQFESLSLDEPMASSWQPPISLKNVYDYDLIPGGMTARQARHVLGAQGHVWGNFIKTPAQVEHAALPRMSALAEILWSAKNRRSWPGFMARVDRLFKRMDLMAANVSRAVYKVAARHSLVENGVRIDLSTTSGTQAIRYTLDGSRPTIHAPVYRAPLVITRRTVIRAVGQDRGTGELYGDFRMTVVPHKALGKKITFLHAPRAFYQPGAKNTILDGVIATDRIFHPTEWAEFYDGNLDAVIDFGEKTQAYTVSFGFDAGQYRRLYSPQSVQILISDDGKTWGSIKEVNEQTINRQRPFLKISFPAVMARYLRVIGVNNRKVFNTRLEKMVPVSIFIDEIIVQ
jgi:hexosaminidase